MTPFRGGSILGLGLLLALTGGCDTGSRGPKAASTTAAATSSSQGATTSGSTGNAPGGSNGAQPDLLAAPPTTPLAATQSTRSGALTAFSFELRLGVQALELSQLELASSGTVDESTLGGAELIEDQNANGLADPGEPVLASAPAASADDAPYTFSFATPLSLPAGSSLPLVVTLDASAATQPQQLAAVGKTIELSLASAAALSATDPQGNAAVPGGTYPVTGTTTLEFGEHVLISEVVVGPGSGSTSAEYVELVNPTAQPIDLENYYLTDFTNDPTQGQFHWKLPLGEDFGPAGSAPSYDFVVRFPAGAQIQPGQVLTVAIDGGGYQAAYASDADYCLRNPATSVSLQMLSWDGVVGGVNFVASPIHDNAGLTNGGEFVCLFSWDGTADLIQDVDLLNYGTSSATNTAVNKSPGQTAPGAPDVRIDSLFDADATESTYQPDADDLTQFNRRAPARPGEVSIFRVDFTEGQEGRTGGNGVTGNDETSEDFGDGTGTAGTFDSASTPTPGALQ